MVLQSSGVENLASVDPLQPLHTTEAWISLLVKPRHGPLDAMERSYCKGYESGCGVEGKNERRVCWDVLFDSGSTRYGLRSSVHALWLRLVEDERRHLAVV